ncbi:helix-turn-helix domain-containing protein [Streptomonospora litoralis]|nr:helix-turn-helix transcriptional regulator [Streptomonospora litoralis]
MTHTRPRAPYRPYRFDHTAFKAELQRRGLEISDLAERTGLSAPGLFKILRGARPYPRAETYQAILTALDLEDGALLVESTPAAAP